MSKNPDDLFDTPPELRARLVSTGELADENLSTSRRISLLAEEVRTGFELLNERLMPLLTRLELKLDALDDRLTRVEKESLVTDRRIKAIEQELGIAKRSQPRKRK